MFLVPCMRFEYWVVHRIAFTQFCRTSAHSTDTCIYIYIWYISFLFVPFFINCWFFCPLLRFERRRRTSPGIRTSGFGADGGSRRYQARQDIQMLWTVKVWEGSTGCEKHPSLVVEVKKRYFWLSSHSDSYTTWIGESSIKMIWIPSCWSSVVFWCYSHGAGVCWRWNCKVPRCLQIDQLRFLQECHAKPR